MNIPQTALLSLLGTPFVVVIWLAFRDHWRASMCAISPDASDPDLEFGTTAVDLGAAVRATAAEVGGLARDHDVQLELAVDPAMPVHGNPNVPGAVLRDTLVMAIRAASGGHVLVTAATLGGQSNIRISDDGPGNDQRPRESLMRDADLLVTLLGGSVDVRATPGRGTTVILRLPVPAAERAEVSEPRQPAVLADQAM
jgi:signal transduction histidine kinase